MKKKPTKKVKRVLKKKVVPKISLSDINRKIESADELNRIRSLGNRDAHDRITQKFDQIAETINGNNNFLIKICNDLLLRTKNTVDLSNENIRIQRMILKNIERLEPETVIESCKAVINQKAFKIFDQITASLDKLNEKTNKDIEMAMYEQLKNKYESK